MDTAQEALFKSMLFNGWFTDSGGNVDSPTGFFGYMYNSPGDYFEVAQVFENIIQQYGHVEGSDFYGGAYFAYVDSNGIIHITNTNTKEEALDLFKRANAEYDAWDGE